MSPFEFFFTLYGLVLGLSIVATVAGVARLVHESAGVKIGILTPLLAIALLVDLCGFWFSSYSALNQHPLDYLLVVISLGAASLYYVAASVVFPQDFSREPDLDSHYMRRRRLVLFSVAISGIVMLELVPQMTPEGRAAQAAFWLDLSRSWLAMVYYVAIVAIALTTNKRANAVLLVAMIMANATIFLRYPPL